MDFSDTRVSKLEYTFNVWIIFNMRGGEKGYKWTVISHVRMGNIEENSKILLSCSKAQVAPGKSGQ